MVIDRAIRSGNEKVDNYIEELEGELLSFNTSSVKRLILAVDEISLRISDDLNNLSRGINTGHFILSEDKDDKTWDRIMALFGKVSQLKDVCEIAESIKPTIKDEPKDVVIPEKVEAPKLSAWEKLVKNDGKGKGKRS